MFDERLSQKWDFLSDWVTILSDFQRGYMQLKICFAFKSIEGGPKSEETIGKETF